MTPVSSQGAHDERAAGARRTFIEQARRAQIVQAAIDTIAELGFAGATIAKIAGRAGVSPALVSYHFAGKQDLVVEVAVEIDARMERAIVARTADVESYAAALRGVIETMVRYFGAHTGEILALDAIYSQAGPDSDLAEMARRRHDQTLDDLGSMFGDAQDAGEFARFDVRTMALAVLAALEAVPAELFARPDADIDELAVELADLFVRAAVRT